MYLDVDELLEFVFQCLLAYIVFQLWVLWQVVHALDHVAGFVIDVIDFLLDHGVIQWVFEVGDYCFLALLNRATVA